MIERIGTAANRTQDPRKVMLRAIRTVVLRLIVFYVVSVLLLHMAYVSGQTLFVTFFGRIGVQGVDAIMNLVVLTAVISLLNAGLYSTGAFCIQWRCSARSPPPSRCWAWR